MTSANSIIIITEAGFECLLGMLEDVKDNMENIEIYMPDLEGKSSGLSCHNNQI